MGTWRWAVSSASTIAVSTVVGSLGRGMSLSASAVMRAISMKCPTSLDLRRMSNSAAIKYLRSWMRSW